jgi:Ca2+-binding RTX toxin-like protein
MVAFDADKSANNLKLDELKILSKKTSNYAKKGILYFEKDGIVIQMEAVVKNNKGEESGKIHTIKVTDSDDNPIWDVGGLNYDWETFWNQVSKGKFDKIFDNFFKKNDTVWGSDFNDDLYGSDGKDTVNGWRGDDRINGGKDKDILKGYIGEDTFVFDQKVGKKNFDKIADWDYYKYEDSIELKQKIFSEFDKGELGKDYFTVGKKADADHAQIIYHQSKGKLFYDPDGTGSADKELFAKINNKKDLSHDDFFVS